MPNESTEKDWIAASGLNLNDLLVDLPKHWTGSGSQFAELIELYGADGVRQMARDLDREIYNQSRIAR